VHSVLAVRGAALQQRKFVIRTHLLLLEAGEGLRPIAPYVRKCFENGLIYWPAWKNSLDKPIRPT